MSTVEKSLAEAVAHALGTSQGEHMQVEVLPLPSASSMSSADRIVRLKTIEEALRDFDSEEGESAGYIVHVRKRPPNHPTPSEPATLEQHPHTSHALNNENVYLNNGKLNVSYLMRNAELLQSTGETALARNIYKAVFQSGERTSAALFGIARCFEAEGRLEEARINYEEAIAYQPDIESYRALGALLIRLGKDQQAAEVYERALTVRDLTPESKFELHKACGNCFFRVQRQNESERHYTKALEINPSADDVRANLGALNLQAGKVAAAKRHFQDAIAANSGNDRALTGLASCLLAEGDKRAAHDAFAKALDTNLNNPNAVFHLVKCAFELRTYAAAARILGDYVGIAPVNANLLYSLAGLQYHLGRIVEARLTVDKVLRIAPGHSGATELKRMMS